MLKLLGIVTLNNAEFSLIIISFVRIRVEMMCLLETFLYINYFKIPENSVAIKNTFYIWF